MPYTKSKYLARRKTPQKVYIKDFLKQKEDTLIVIIKTEIGNNLYYFFSKEKLKNCKYIVFRNTKSKGITSTPKPNTIDV
jgi:hypothetical protein